MLSVTTELPELLSTVRRPGDFYATGTIEILAPHLEVAGVGPVAFPLLPVQAEQLVAVAEPAPYGRGEATLVDTAVRRTWQINADRVHLEGRGWEQTLETIVNRVAADLGVTGVVIAELYKLLVYDQGSFFVSHRDTEKAPGMFATLIIVLPSIYTGGELVVRHRDREVTLDLRCPEPSEVAFAAFYADCVHEVRPITSGCRLALVYNLLRRSSRYLPKPPDYTAEQTDVTALLQAWVASKSLPDDESPEKLIYPLEHAYTPAELAFTALKGVDAAVASLLAAAAPAAGCDLHLALLTIEESGGAEYIGGGDPYRWGASDDEDDYEVVEVFDRSETLSDWRCPDGSQPTLGAFDFTPEELCPPDALADLEPDEQHFHEATGNEGASFDRTYHRAALVLWPHERRLRVLNQAGLAVTLPYLGELTRRCAESGAGSESPLWVEAHELAGYMLDTWPRQTYGPLSGQQPSSVGELLALLGQRRDTACIDAFLANLATPSGYSEGDNPALIRAVGLLPPARAAELIEGVIAGNAAVALSACGDLLARCVTARVTEQPAALSGAAAALVAALPGDPSRAPPPDTWRRVPLVEPPFVINLLTALEQIAPALAEQAVDYILAWPQTYGPDAVLVPAAVGLTKGAAKGHGAAVQRLRTACLEHLEARIAEPLEQPRNWVRASELACHCGHCRELSRFLADPSEKTWTFKAPQAQRNHLEYSIRQSNCDLDTVTVREGRPYRLVCTKNQASYERRAQQRKQDLANRKRLET